MVDINVITEEVRNFARQGTGFNDAALRPLLVTPKCSGVELPGCSEFQRADMDAAKGLMQAVTRAEQFVNGIRQGAEKMAGLYDDADANAAAVLQRVRLNGTDVEVREEGLPQVNRDLETALRLNSAG